jgi:hypothetical protein
MSDTESAAATPAAAHPIFGGKSIESVQQQQTRLQSDRPPYKSWRKKYRKMRHVFDTQLEQNKVLFRQEHKLEGTARRLREELDELLEILLDVNQSPAIPSELRFDVRLPSQKQQQSLVPPEVTPRESNELIADYTAAIQQGRIPPLDLHVVREQLNNALAAQNVTQLEALEQRTPHPILTGHSIPNSKELPDPPNYLTTEEESVYLARLDAQLDNALGLDTFTKDVTSGLHPADLTPRELERQMELLNPHSQHNWLKMNTKIHDEAADTDSLDGAATTKTPAPRKRANKNLAKQVGDRAVERAREGQPGSPSAASGFEEDELGVLLPPGEELSGSGKKRVKDPDGAYRLKGGNGGGSSKGKRKRTVEEGGSAASGSKKMKVGDEGAEAPAGGTPAV